MVIVTNCEAVGKGRLKVYFDNGITCLLYRGEASRFDISLDASLSKEKYDELIVEVVGKRATKRAMHLLEQMDRTEYQLRDKLAKNDYPQCCIDQAIEYVKKYNYIDDNRYACNYVRFHQEKLSRQQIKQKLIQKGLGRDIIEWAIEEEFESDEMSQITELLRKRKYDSENVDQKEFQRTYQFLMRRGFKSSDILKAMKCQMEYD